MKVIYISDDYILVNEDDRVIKKDYKYEKGIITASLEYKNIININFKLPRNIEKEMLEIEAEKYLFTQGSLDYNKEYKIVYKFREYEDFYNVEAFVVDIENLKRVFEKDLKTFKYIDFISAAPFVFESFYEITGIVAQNDMFVFLSDEEAFVSCFENGEFLFVKSITKLSALATQLGVDKEKLKEILSSKGLNTNEYEDIGTAQIIESFFSELFMKISHLINYSINNYRLNAINTIYFYSDYDIKGLFEKYTDFWHLSGITFKKYSIPTEYNPFEYTALIYNTKHYTNEEENFSIFLRPLPFYKTKSGQFIMFSLLVLLGLVSYYGYLSYEVNKLEKKVRIKEKEKKIYLKKLKFFKTALKKKEEEIEKLLHEDKNLQKNLKNILVRLNFLEKKEKYSFYNQLAKIVSLLKKNNLKIISFEKENHHYVIYIKSKYDISKNIAQFMKDLYKNNFINIKSNYAQLNVEKGKSYYVSKVEFDEYK